MLNFGVKKTQSHQFCIDYYIDNPHAAHGFSSVLNILHLLNTCASYEDLYSGEDVVKFDKVTVEPRT